MKPSVDGKVSHEVDSNGGGKVGNNGGGKKSKTWDDVKPKKQDKKESNDEFTEREIERFKELMKQFMYGVPAKSKYEHFHKVTIQFRPQLHDQIMSLLNEAPEGWFKTKMDLYRAVLTVGMNVMSEILRFNGAKIKRFNENINKMNKMAAYSRELELSREFKEFENELRQSDVPYKEEMAREFVEEMVPEMWDIIKDIIGRDRISKDKNP